MSNTPVELRLQAKFEAGTADQDAAALGTKMAAAFEKAFASLGDRLGQQIVEGIQRRLGTLSLPGSGSGGYSSSGSMDAPEGMASSAASRFSAISAPPARDPVTGEAVVPGSSPASASFGGPSDAAHQAERVFRQRVTTSRINGVTSLIQSTLYNTPGLSGPENHLANLPALNDARAADATYGKLRLFNSAGGGPKEMGSYGLSRESIQEAIKTYDTTIKGAGPEMTRLIDSIRDLTKSTDKNKEQLESLRKKAEAGEDLSPKQRRNLAMWSKDEGDLAGQQGSLADMEGSLGASAKAKAAMEGQLEQMKWYRNPAIGKYAAGVAGVAGVAGAAMGLASNAGIWEAQGRAGTAAMQGFTARDIMAGNYVGGLATHMAGGEEALRSRSRFDSTMGIGTSILGSIGTAAGAVMSGGPLSAPLGLASVGFASNAYRGIMERDSDIASRMKQYQSAGIGQHQEMLEAYASARSNAVGAYHSASAMGSDNYAGFLTGLSAPAGTRGMGNTVMRAYTHDNGIDLGAMQQDLQTYQSFGGAYGGSNMMKDMSAEVREGASLRARGFASVAASRTAFARGSDTYFDTGDAGADRNGRLASMRSGWGMADQTFKDIRGAGFEESVADRWTSQVAGVAGRGIGEAGYADTISRMAAAQAKSIGATDPEQAMLVLGLNQRVQDNSRTGQGPAGFASIQSAHQLGNSLSKIKGKDGKGIQASEKELIEFQLMDFGASDLMKKYGISKEDAERLNSEHKGNVLKNTRALYENALGVGPGDTMFNIANGAHSIGQGDEMTAAMNSGLTAQDFKHGNYDQSENKVVGRAEAKQEAGDAATKVIVGTQKLAEAFDILKKSSEAFADRLDHLAQTTSFKDQDKAPSVGDALMSVMFPGSKTRTGNATPSK